MDALLAWSSEDARGKSVNETPFHEEAWLLGQPPLRKYLDFVTDMAIGGAAMARAEIIDEWRAANDYYAELETREAGIADQAATRELDPGCRALADDVMADARWDRGFDAL